MTPEVADRWWASLLRHGEALRFLVVGGVCFLVTSSVNYLLKLTVLAAKPVTALMIATVLATCLSYVLNREWTFHARGGRRRVSEAALFFGINGIATVINAFPLWVSRYVLDLREPAVSRLVQEGSDLLSGIIAGTALAMAFRLWAYRKWVFPLRSAGPDIGRTGPGPRPLTNAPDRASAGGETTRHTGRTLRCPAKCLLGRCREQDLWDRATRSPPS